MRKQRHRDKVTCKVMAGSERQSEDLKPCDLVLEATYLNHYASPTRIRGTRWEVNTRDALGHPILGQYTVSRAKHNG